MLKKSNAMPYTIIERMRSMSPFPGLPMPKSPNRSKHAHEHDLLDAEAFEEEGYGEDKEGLGHLRDG